MMPFENARRSPRKANCFGMTLVARHDGGERRQAGEGRVRGEDQDQRRRDLDDVEDDVLAEDASRRSARRPSSTRTGTMPIWCARIGRADEEDARGSPPSRPGSSRRSSHSGGLKLRHAVGHRLDTGKGGATGGEGPQQQEERQRAACRPRSGSAARRRAGRRRAASRTRPTTIMPPKLKMKK